MVNYIPEFQGYSGQGAFRYWCQKVLPLVYDDSLSYYELLNKVVVYLNNTIEDVAKAEGNIDSLLTAYTQLQGYVNDYFDNLDVQEEINHKLDDMATDGSLSNLIRPLINEPLDAWLSENVIIPEGGAVTLDPTLSLANAAAQAKATGDAINDVADDLDTLSDKVVKYKLIDPTTLNSLAEFPVGYMCAGITFAETSWTDYPPDCSSGIITCCQISAAKKLQLIYEYTTSSTNITNFYWRVINMNSPYTALMEWQKLANVKDIENDMAIALRSSQKYIQHSNLQGYTDANDFEANYMYEIASDVVATDIANLPEYGEPAYIFTPTYNPATAYSMQIYINQYKMYTRIKRVGGWDTWAGNINYHAITPSDYNSVAELPYNFFCTITFSNTSWTDYPQGLVAGAFFSYKYAPNYKLQFIVQISQSNHNINRIWFRTVNANTYEVYSDWMQMPNIDDVNSIIETTVLPNTIKYISSLRSYLTEINKTKLGDIKENAIVLYNKVVDGAHPENNFSVPDSAFDSMILLNMRYAINYNIQFAFTTNCKEFKYRIVDRRDGSEYTTWKAPDSFDGKVCLALGDSICYGARNGRKGFIGYFNLSVMNESRVAARLSNTRINEDTGEYKSYCIYKQLIDFATDTETSTYVPDIIISDGGVNDYAYVNNSVQLGTFNGIPKTTDAECESLDLSTIAGGTEYLFYNMIKYYPSAQRFFVLTHKTNNYPYTQNTNGYTQTDAYDLIKNIAKSYGVYVIDIFNESMINTAFSQYISPIPYSSSNPSATADYYVDDDGIHPLDKGYREGYVPLVRKALTITTLKPQITNFSGDVVRFWQYSGGEKLKSVVTQITGGDRTHVDLMVTKKNMLLRPYIYDDTYENRGITFTVQENGTVTASGTLSGASQPYNALKRIWLQPGVIYSISHGCNHPRAFCVGYFRDYANTQNITPAGWDVDLNRAISTTYISCLNAGSYHAKRTFYVNEPCVLELQLRFNPSTEAQTITDAVFKPMLYVGGEVDDWDTAPTYKTAQGQLISIPLGTTVDEGELNVTTGELTVTQPSAATYQLTPTEVATLNGFNQIIADTGAVSVVRSA